MLSKSLLAGNNVVATARADTGHLQRQIGTIMLQSSAATIVQLDLHQIADFSEDPGRCGLTGTATLAS